MLEPRGGLEESLTSSGFSHWALSTEPFEAAGWTAAGEKCRQTETRADEQDQSAAGPRFTLEKPLQAARAREEEQTEMRRGGGGEVEGGGCINGPLYCFVLVKLRAQISWQHLNRTRWASSSRPRFGSCFSLQRPENRESAWLQLSDGTGPGGDHRCSLVKFMSLKVI